MITGHLRKDIAEELFEAPDPDQPFGEVIAYGYSIETCLSLPFQPDLNNTLK